MGFLNQIAIDKNKCTGCGICMKACPAELLSVNESGHAYSKPVTTLNWYGCWKCQHCMAVCPAGAISVLGYDPDKSLAAPGREAAGIMDALATNRRSCRHYVQKNVDRELLSHILEMSFCAPTAGNKQFYEYTLIDDIEQMNRLRALVRKGYRTCRQKGFAPFSWDDESLAIMESRERQAMNGDMFFCSAPHLIIPHQPAAMKAAPVDINLALAYFELLCAAHGLGTVYLAYPMNWMREMPEVWELLGIPDDHYVNAALGFGVPAFRYQRGVQKPGSIPVHRPVFPE